MRLAIAMAAALAAAQDPPKKPDPAPAHPKVDQARVDRAIQKGVEFLKRAPLGTTSRANHDVRWDELVLWTFVHAGVPYDDPVFSRLFKGMMEGELERTYNVSLQAMILEELDRVKHQGRIQQCAQFLVDNQCKNGQWSYGEPTPFAKDIPTGGSGGKPDVETPGGRPAEAGEKPKAKPAVTTHVTVRKRRDGPDRGDNSNSQYAALGLRACADAGVSVPNAVLNLGAQWWRDSQHDEKKKEGYAGEGWCYGSKDHPHGPYGSMTAGAVGSLVIYQYLLGKPWKADRDITLGVEWMARHFTVSENPGPCEHGGGKPEVWLYYWLYALERAGMLYGTELFGGHEWYPIGANWLLDHQAKDGSWSAGSAEGANGVWDTCFAILFLRRATRPLKEVATK